MNSTLAISSNLMPEDPKYKPEYRYVPGDYVGRIYPNVVDVRSMREYLSEQQIIELQQYLVCSRCGKTCAGTCTGFR